MNAYTQAFIGAFRRQLRDRGSMTYTSVFYFILMIAWGAVWWAATQAAGGSIDGYTFDNIIWYMLATEAAVIVVPARRIEQIGEEIAAGEVESEMLRPVSVSGLRLAMSTGQALARLVPVVIMAFGLGVIYARDIPNGASLVLALPAMVLAVACNVIALHAFASISFWVRDSNASWFLFQKSIFFFGGMLLPMQMMPEWMVPVAWTLPFWTMAYATGRLASGAFEPWLIAGQLGWVAVLTLCAVGLFAIGQRRIRAGVA